MMKDSDKDTQSYEDMAHYWIQRLLQSTSIARKTTDEPLSQNEQMHCLLFSCMFIGLSLDAIDSRLMKIENLMYFISDVINTKVLEQNNE